AVETGWWKDRELYPNESAHAAVKLLMIHSEVTEAVEGLRCNLMDDHLPHRKMVEVELGDIIVRVLDLAGGLNLDLEGAIVEKLEYNATRLDHKPENRAKDNGKAF
ncbi:MAG: hypothetical protein KAS32_21350, partial [Candidatus Peribacteraceae bacterium]|nr:hypothetical protein [Candidatus Peribacteraceae bacterium]